MPKTKISHIDQRLAAQTHLRQIESIVRLERLAEAIEVGFQVAGRKLIDIANAGQSSPQVARMLFLQAFKDAQTKLFAGFEDHAQWSYDTAVTAMATAIPRVYFRKNFIEFQIAGLEDENEPKKTLVAKRIKIGLLNIDNLSEPIATNRKKLTKKEWEKAIKEIVFPAPSERRVQELINAVDDQGRDWQDRLLILSSKVSDAEQLGNQLAFGFSAGENLQQLKNRALPLVNGIQSSAKRIVRTEGLRIAERIQRESWDALGDMMVGVQVLAVLDQNTRPHHALRNGTVYAKNPKGKQLPMDQLPMLPDEANCRCYSAPILAPPEELKNDPEVAAEFKNAQGVGIPDPATYDKWFQQADPVRRKLAVGSRRYSEMASILSDARQPEWTDFIDEDGVLIPIDQLKSETIIERNARKAELTRIIRRRKEKIQELSTKGF